MSSDDDGSLSERTIVPISKAMLEEVDDWRYANRVPSKAEAMRRLIRAGLDATKTKSRRK
jgi:metal-responsive CopG/Arc/MetJ family transcriptional regulator